MIKKILFSILFLFFIGSSFALTLSDFDGYDYEPAATSTAIAKIAKDYYNSQGVFATSEVDYTFYIDIVKDDICSSYEEPHSCMSTNSETGETNTYYNYCEDTCSIMSVYRCDKNFEDYINENCPSYDTYINNPNKQITSIDFEVNDVGNRRSIYKVIFDKPVNTSTSNYFDNNFEYDFYYNSANNFFSLDNTNKDLDNDITNIFTIPTNFGLSRVALFRQFTPQKQIYGYESAETFAVTSINGSYPVYTTNFEGFDGNIKELCMASLGTYSPIEGAGFEATIPTNKQVICGSDYIKLNSKSFKEDDKFSTAFNLFKNIILGLKNE